ncbi:RNA polymerase sigma-70 factor (ECF subfamily) [Kribbella amoyensis]|uniref:RNA polymerase sigma-70 factor (ECF subfamily) n=1 Tax=Kribbella amoyensis TaxID=996641 RepID=A0A561BQ34_9ACTN|nr:sigma-70 family RNA polymerase sigma factor [Kribbella amoyensis]TWD80980.1 RNA polymerase sigma-70 factor (ECF subfamily) [Kribbella amoyensis]
MDERDFLAARFEDHRLRLRAVAYRMLGSQAEADDAVQETWLRLNRSDPGTVDNLGGWLTTVVGRVCLNMLRTRTRRREESLEVVGPAEVGGVQDPEQEALLADSVGVALLVVLETLTPAERLAFVLHDLFSVPFEEIAPIVGRNQLATRQLASRARRRVRGAVDSSVDAAGSLSAEEPLPTGGVDAAIELIRQREVVEAFLAAARGGDLEALVAVLDPEVVVRTDGGPWAGRELRGVRVVADGAATFVQVAELTRVALVDGALGVAAGQGGTIGSVAVFTFAADRIVALDIISAAERLTGLEIVLLDR